MSEQNERPIRFTPEMALAVFEGRKTVTRRVMKQQPCRQPVLIPNGGESYWSNPLYIQGAMMGSQNQACPYGKQGDLLITEAPNGEQFRLEITDIRVEQVQMISIGEILKEGLAESMYQFIPVTAAFEYFEEFWDSIYGAGSWKSNPWVWVVEFKRLDQSA